MAVTPVDLKGAKILVTGPTGQVAAPVLDALCDVAELTALARFSDKAARLDLEKRGIHTVRADMDSLAACPQDVDYVLNFAVVKTGLFDYDLAANGEGVGNVMAHCRNVKAFYICHLRRFTNMRDSHRAVKTTLWVIITEQCSPPIALPRLRQKRCAALPPTNLKYQRLLLD